MVDDMAEREPAARVPGSVRRRPVGISLDNLVESRPLFEDGTLPLLVQPRVQGLDLVTWAAGRRDFIEASLAT